MLHSASEFSLNDADRPATHPAAAAAAAFAAAAGPLAGLCKGGAVLARQSGGSRRLGVLVRSSNAVAQPRARGAASATVLKLVSAAFAVHRLGLDSSANEHCPTVARMACLTRFNAGSVIYSILRDSHVHPVRT